MSMSQVFGSVAVTRVGGPRAQELALEFCLSQSNTCDGCLFPSTRVTCPSRARQNLRFESPAPFALQRKVERPTKPQRSPEHNFPRPPDVRAPGPAFSILEGSPHGNVLVESIVEDVPAAAPASPQEDLSW